MEGGFGLGRGSGVVKCFICWKGSIVRLLLPRLTLVHST